MEAPDPELDDTELAYERDSARTLGRRVEVTLPGRWPMRTLLAFALNLALCALYGMACEALTVWRFLSAAL